MVGPYANSSKFPSFLSFLLSPVHALMVGPHADTSKFFKFEISLKKCQTKLKGPFFPVKRNMVLAGGLEHISLIPSYGLACMFTKVGKQMMKVPDSLVFGVYILLDTRISVCPVSVCPSVLRDPQGTPPEFWNGLDWKGLVELHIPNLRN